ncbi:hypothetical protein CXG81DRAFT_20796 [Caulochytrium protostelioides]|uniref:Uncharacterized protein n=1 Tax=Caulochytrium protostelioides TaxID=1555241 RepID=A0A4P9X210_9FUNG|nr:hypothetical protein CXG81DRAFT_20796 [Caulochytrium protostelioides]|eukprot:RKO99073.1 hypothetical protein CXG81DRAFT_20796 [Caulochytrium protostelioides]
MPAAAAGAAARHPAAAAAAAAAANTVHDASIWRQRIHDEAVTQATWQAKWGALGHILYPPSGERAAGAPHGAANAPPASVPRTRGREYGHAWTGLALAPLEPFGREARPQGNVMRWFGGTVESLP